ncbi:MAG: hypothetical protein P1P82_04305 [Bacteroidales bacterium]|nr:hypothetical protein [Bacteroidales bacterium]MDT8432023.1 hypothetical protein [Bacteroidales bacterium]
MRNDRKARENSGDRIDRIYRYAMLVMGILAAVLFLASLVAMVEFPGAFIYLAIGMVATAVVFLLLRTIYRFRDNFRVKH